MSTLTERKQAAIVELQKRSFWKATQPSIQQQILGLPDDCAGYLEDLINLLKEKQVILQKFSQRQILENNFRDKKLLQKCRQKKGGSGLERWHRFRRSACGVCQIFIVHRSLYAANAGDGSGRDQSGRACSNNWIPNIKMNSIK